ncbi:MAG TPA: hypothetical protein VKJ07_02655 [Mycobacteriales bacterium]|nr:hypothetical protein [Mycobacteriales bacterium]
MTDSTVVHKELVSGLDTFQAAQGEVLALRLTGRADPDRVQVITYQDGEFTLGLRAARPGVVVPAVLVVLDDDALSALLAALRRQVDSPPADLAPDLPALRAAVDVLEQRLGEVGAFPFEHARFADVIRDACGGIVAHLGLGIDTAGTVHDTAGAVSFSTHVVPLPPGPFRPLSRAERRTLARALTAFLDATPRADRLWQELLNDLRRTAGA